jgi:hypothetical protein
MSTMDSRRIGVVRETERRPVRPVLYGFVSLAVFVAAVVLVAVMNGTGAAIATAFLVFTIPGTALGLVGVGVAVKETELEVRSQNELIRTVPVGNTKPAR